MLFSYLHLPSEGRLRSATEVTPGRSRESSSGCPVASRATRSPSSQPVPQESRYAVVWIRSGRSNPGSTFRRAWKLRNHETGGDEEDDRQRYLRRRRAAFCERCWPRLAAGRSTIPARSRAHEELPAPCVPAYLTIGRSPKSAAERSETRKRRRSSTGWIDREFRKPRQCCGPQSRPGDARPAVHEHHSASASAKQGKYQAFHQQLACDVTPASAQGRAHRQLLAAPLGPHEQEVCDIRARNHQHDANGCPSAATAPAPRRRSRPA